MVETIDLTRRFDRFIAVDRVSFSVQAGEAFGLIGANGAGKSTIIRMLTTLLPITSGAGTVAGYDITTQPAQVRRHIGYVPQLLSTDGALTAWENLLLSARLYDIPHRQVRTRIEQALMSMELMPFAHQLVQGFSGGMIRRLEIAQSMLHRPAILFMDEPTVGLDPMARRAVLDHVGDLRRHRAGNQPLHGRNRHPLRPPRRGQSVTCIGCRLCCQSLDRTLPGHMARRQAECCGGGEGKNPDIRGNILSFASSSGA